MHRDLAERVVQLDGVKIVVREARVDEGACTRYTAELSLHGGSERAVVDSLAADEYPVILAAAVKAFAASVRLRRVLP